jgi:2-dehydrotetronate isomerase
MPKFAANLSMLYPELDFLDRFGAAAKDGFKAVEYLFPYAHDAKELKSRLNANGLRQVLFNAPPGEWDKGEKGLACLPGREGEFRSSIAKAIEYARVLECPRVHVMAGLAPEKVDRTVLRRTYVDNLRFAASEAAKAGLDVLIEPINTRDIPRFFLNRQDEAHAIVQEVGAANLKVQFDLYHCQIVEGDVAMKIRHYLPTGRVGHFQIAGVPQRHEPDAGEVNYAYLFDVIDEVSAQCGWDGYVGCEYRPAGDTSAGLKRWFARWR